MTATYALTSLAPGDVAVQRRSIASWRAIGLVPRAFQHPSEIPALRRHYDNVEFVPVDETSRRHLGQHYIPINRMLDAAASCDAPVLLINADIEIVSSPHEFANIRASTSNGLCCFFRFDHSGDKSKATRFANGFDAFLFDGRHAVLFARSFLSMGQTFWDHWLPCTFMKAGVPIFAVDYPMAYHLSHACRWSGTYRICEREFRRLMGRDKTLWSKVQRQLCRVPPPVEEKAATVS